MYGEEGGGSMLCNPFHIHAVGMKSKYQLLAHSIAAINLFSSEHGK